MRINNARVTNFKALRGDREFELPTGIIGIVGSNGQGKSNLTRAIAWALYGPLVFEKGMNSADVISWGEDAAAVSLNFTVAGQEFDLVRTQVGSSSNASLKGPVEAQGADAVTKAVADLMSIDRVGFLASVFSRQKDLEGLASLAGPDRTKTVLRLRGLDQITKAIDKVSEEGRESKKALAAIRSALPNPRPIPEYDGMLRDYAKELKIAETRLKELKSRERDLEAEVTSLVQEQTSLASTRQSYLNYVSAKATASTNLENALVALEEAKRLAAEPAPKAPKKVKPVDRTIETEIRDRIASTRSRITELRKAIAAGTVCPACTRPYDNAEEIEKAKALHAEELEACEEALVQHRTDLEVCTKLIAADDAYWRAMDKWQAEHEQWQKRQGAVEAAQKAADALEHVLADLEPVKDVTPAYDALVLRTREVQNRKAETASFAATAASNVERLNSKIESLKAEREVAKEMTAKLGALEKSTLEHEVGANLLKEFKKVQTSTLIPAISARASDLLSRMTDGKYSELILTPEWEIQYRYEDGEIKAFANLSVGERNTFALALRLALAELGSVGLLVLDEVLDALDEDRQNLTWEALESLLGRYEQIIVITHVAAFKERAPHIIQL